MNGWSPQRTGRSSSEAPDDFILSVPHTSTFNQRFAHLCRNQVIPDNTIASKALIFKLRNNDEFQRSSFKSS